MLAAMLFTAGTFLQFNYIVVSFTIVKFSESYLYQIKLFALHSMWP